LLGLQLVGIAAGRYKYAPTPDALFMIATYAATAILAGMGAKIAPGGTPPSGPSRPSMTRARRDAYRAIGHARSLARASVGGARLLA
jgi:hypothetical protein